MSIESQQNTVESDELSLKELVLKSRSWIRFLLSRWKLIILFILLGVLLGCCYAFLKRPVYTAKTTFVLEEEKGTSGIGALAGLASMAGVDFAGGGGIFQGDNILELYRSRMMIEKTLLSKVAIDGKDKLLLDRYFAINQTAKKNPELLSMNFNQPRTKFSRKQDSLLGLAVEDIALRYLDVSKPDKKLSVIQAVVKSKDEFFSKSFNNEIVKNVNEFYVITKTKKSLENVNILKQQVDSVRAVMNGAIYSAVAVSDATPNLNPTRQIQRVAPVQRSQFSAETNKAILSELVKNLELARMTLRKERPLIQVIDEPVLPLEKKELTYAKGSLIGAFLMGFLGAIFIILKKIYNDIVQA